MKELVDMSKMMQTPSITVRLLPSFQKLAEPLLSIMAKSLESLYMKDVVEVFHVMHLQDIEQDPQYLEVLEYEKPFRDKNVNSAKLSEHVIHFRLNKSHMLDRNIRPAQVENLIQTFSLHVHRAMSSEANMKEWSVWLRLNNIQQSLNGMCSEAFGSRMKPKCAEGRKRRRDLDKRLCHSTAVVLMKELKIGGIEYLQKAEVSRLTTQRTHPQTGEIQMVKERVIETIGCPGKLRRHTTQKHEATLLEIWKLPYADWKNTISNCVHEIHLLLGLEAAVKVLFNEIRTVLSFDGTYVNDRHIMLLVNIMTYRGVLMPVNRFGLNRLPKGPLNKCTFEETVEVLSEAACFGITDGVRGVSSNIMLGQLAPAGTGVSQCISTQVLPDLIDEIQEDVIQTFLPLQKHVRSVAENDPLADWICKSEEVISLVSHHRLSHQIEPPFESRIAQPQGHGVQDLIAISSGLVFNLDNLTDTEQPGQSYRPSSPILQRVARQAPQYRPSTPDMVVFE